MQLNRFRVFAGLVAAAVLAVGSSAAHAASSGDTLGNLLGDGDSFVQVTPAGHVVAGECHWRGSASDTGTDAVLYGYSTTDATAVGTTIHCWLRNVPGTTHVANTDTQAGGFGGTAVTQRQITVPPPPYVTAVCYQATALYLDGSSANVKAKGC